MEHKSWLPYPSELAGQILQQNQNAPAAFQQKSSDAVEKLYARLCDEIELTTRTLSKIEWQSYGSGYASFVDAWFYRAGAEFVSTPIEGSESYTGLVVLFCRVIPAFAFMQGMKSWNKRGGSSYLPSFEQIDDLSVPAVHAISLQVQPILERAGLQRLRKADLAPLLDANTVIETNLGDPPYREFDALFHWMD